MTPTKPEPRLLLACGCVIAFEDGKAPTCVHGAQRVVRTIGMPPPRIRGVAMGPHVETTDLPAWTGQLSGKG